MVNPDNFILHSDFWYPTNYKSGVLTVNNASIPATFTLSNQYNDGDYYSVFIEYTNQSMIYDNQPSDTMYARTKGNNLLVFKGAQSAGQKLSANFHWRIYPKNTKLNFLSANNLETTDKTLTGTYTGNFSNLSISSGLSGRYFLRGVWRYNGGSWQIINGYNTQAGAIFYAYYDYSANAVKGRAFTTDGTNGTFEWRIQLVPIDLPNKFIFNSNKYSFAIPQSKVVTINDPGGVAANTSKYIYGDWITKGNANIPYDALYKWAGNTDHDTERAYDEFHLVGVSDVVAYPYIETSGNQIRPVLKVTNTTSSNVNYAAQTFQYYIYIYQNNNAS